MKDSPPQSEHNEKKASSEYASSIVNKIGTSVLKYIKPRFLMMILVNTQYMDQI